MHEFGIVAMTSKLRVIDLCTQILAPILTGQVMTWLGIQYGAVLIGVWNLLSVFVEYYLILKVYQEVPALKSKMYKKKTDKDGMYIIEAVLNRIIIYLDYDIVCFLFSMTFQNCHDEF